MNRKRVCQHCQEAFDLASTGRPPKYCSATCRKAAWEARKMAEAVAVAVAKAVAAERRRANRGNETPLTPGNRGNETPPQARGPEGDFLLAPPAPVKAPPPVPPVPVRSALPPGPSKQKRRRLLPPPPGVRREPTLFEPDGTDGGQLDVRPGAESP